MCLAIAWAGCGGDDSTSTAGPDAGNGGASGSAAGGTAGSASGGRGGGDAAFDPCAGKACGLACTLCRPNDPGCVGIEMWCDRAGACTIRFPMCQP
jgi:hypothetical protein